MIEGLRRETALLCVSKGNDLEVNESADIWEDLERDSA